MENGTWLVSLIFSKFKVFGEILHFVHTHIHPSTRYISRGCVYCVIYCMCTLSVRKLNPINSILCHSLVPFCRFFILALFCFNNFFAPFVFYQEFLERRTVWRTTVVQSPMSISPSRFTSGDQEIEIIFSFHLKWTVEKMLHVKFEHNVKAIIFWIDTMVTLNICSAPGVEHCITSSTWSSLACSSPPWLFLDSHFHLTRGRNSH